jgi:hypothetical protein
MQNNAKIGGILSIVSWAWGILWGILMIVVVSILAVIPFRTLEPAPPREFFAIFAVLYGIFGGIFMLIGVLAIVGGIYALKKRIWGLALAGSIGAVIAFFPCGIPAIIFVAMGKPEFAGQGPPAPLSTPPQQAGG